MKVAKIKIKLVVLFMIIIIGLVVARGSHVTRSRYDYLRAATTTRRSNNELLFLSLQIVVYIAIVWSWIMVNRLEHD